MGLLDRAFNHFQEDIGRARDLQRHASSLPSGVLKGDILRSSWMMGVGAADAYFCDAYADLISRTLNAKRQQSTVEITGRLARIEVPVIAVIGESNNGWRWRMIARGLIEKESVLSLDDVRKLFGTFFPKRRRLLTASTIDQWILRSDAPYGCFGLCASEYRHSSGDALKTQREMALRQFEKTFSDIFQRRHDCIHNCDRPKNRPLPITFEKVKRITNYVDFLCTRMDQALREEFPDYLRRIGCNGVTRNSVLG